MSCKVFDYFCLKQQNLCYKNGKRGKNEVKGIKEKTFLYMYIHKSKSQWHMGPKAYMSPCAFLHSYIM